MQPADLLDDYVAAIGPSMRLGLSATAVRNRSADARHLLARAALGPAATLDELLRAARDGDRRWVRRLRPKARPGLLAALAQTIALQELSEADRRDSLALYALVREAFGADALSPAQQSLHAQLTYAWEGAEAVPGLLGAYRRMRPAVRTALEVDLCNPFVAPRPPEPWLAAFQALLPEPAPSLGGNARLCAFDRLGYSTPPAKVEAPQRISVVITSYRPDEGLITAVRSILAQTWRNVEVIIVDDASPAEHDEVLSRAAALGDRIRLVRQPANLGTYAARNVGLDLSGGEFVAFQDSDDWSHPRRLELQVAPLLAGAGVVASTSDALSVTADLLLNRAGVRTGRFNPSSLLIRRAAVLGRIGYFDRLRKAADSEYLGRIEAAFGADAVRHLDQPLALVRLSENSLSRAEIRPHWMHPARVAYRSAYLHWHRAIAAGDASPHLAADVAVRPFAAPPHLLGRPADGTFDVVFAGDWRYAGGSVRSAVDEMRALVAAGRRVALVQVESYRNVHRMRMPLCTAIQDLVNAGAVDQVHLGDPCSTDLLLVRQAEVLQFAPDERSAIQAGRVLVVADAGVYDPVGCSARVRRLFGKPAVWCPQDPGLRAGLPEGLDVTSRDLPIVVDADGWWSARSGATAAHPIVGVDLCDQEVPAISMPSSVDMRIRLADRPPGTPAPGVPKDWLVFPAGEVGERPFLHQLDFYLHFSEKAFSRPALEAAAAGCVVILPERSAALYGDAAIYAEPAEVPGLIRRYAADPALFAEQSRRAKAVVATAHHPRLFVDAVARRNDTARVTVEQRGPHLVPAGGRR